MIVLISGVSATGKTTIGRQLAEYLGYEFYSKDTIKEEMFNRHKRHALLWWYWYDKEAKRAFFDRLAKRQSAGEMVVAESNFELHDRRHLRAILRSADTTEFFLYAKPEIVVRRFFRRWLSGGRHPGHMDWFWAPLAFVFYAAAKLGIMFFHPTTVTQRLMRVDTTDFDEVSIECLAQFVKTRP